MLNLVSENWKKYGPNIDIKAKNFSKTIKWGKKTKDPKYKNLWYQLIKEFSDGADNLEQRTVSTNSSHEENDGRNRSNK